jgi:FkbM family methyltransferase
MKNATLSRPLELLSNLVGASSRERIKSLLVRTPAEGPLKALRTVWELRHLRERPELHAIYTEGLVIDRVLRRIVRVDSNCIDIGCHIGSTLSELLELAPRGNHAAFEPIPSKADWLRRRFPEVEVFEVALADREGEATFYVNTKATGFSGLQRHGEHGEHEALTVRTARLDALLGDRRVDFIKLDVEGGELRVLQGATGVLERHRPRILLECTASSLAAHGITPQEMFGWLTAQGYGIWTPSAYLTEREPLDLEGFMAAQTYPFQAFNFFAESLATRR